MTRLTMRSMAPLTLLATLLTVDAGNTMVDLLSDGIRKFESGDVDAAKEFLSKAVSDNPENAEAQYYLGRVYFQQGDMDKAEDHFKEAVELDEQNSMYHTWLGNTYGDKIQRAGVLKRMGIAKKIKRHYERGLELDENNHEARVGLIQFYLEAPGIAGGSKDKAREHAEILKQKDTLRGLRAFARIYEKEENYELAERAYVDAIAGAPEDAGTRFRLGYFYQERKMYDKAFELFEAMSMDSSTHFNALYQIGRTAVFSGENLDRAIAAISEYLSHQPDSNSPSLASAHWRRGMLYEHKNEIQMAKAEYESALALEPDNENAKKALKKLK